MIKSQLVKKLLNKNPHLIQKDVENITSLILKKITTTLEDNRRVEIRGFGTFSKKYIRPRKFTNPKTKKISYLGETATMHFKPSKALIKK